MRNAVIAAIGVCAAVSLGAQQQKPAAPAKPPVTTKPAARIIDGHPDFTGMYDLATMTPVERLPGVKDLVLTKEQADAAENYEAQRNAKDDQPLKGDRDAPPTGGERPAGKSYLEQLEFFGGGVVGGYNRFWLAEGSKLATVEGQKRSSIVIDPPDGHVPPTNEIGRSGMRRIWRARSAPMPRSRLRPGR